MKKLALISATILIGLFATQSFAKNAPASGDYLTLYAGDYAISDSDESAVQFGAEYRFAPMYWNVLRPIIGANITTDSSLYGYAGFGLDFSVGNNISVMPYTAVGAYNKQDGKDLGGTIEFRSGIEVGYQMENSHRVGIAFNHISNASIYDHNPGAEALILTYSIPMN